MGFLDTIGQLASTGGAVTGNPWATGIGAAINLFNHKSTDPAVQQYQGQARQYGAQADEANGYYTSEAATGKNRENELVPQYQQAFNDALKAHQGGYYWGNQNYSQARAQALQNGADATNSAYQRASANTEANMLKRGLTGSSMDAGTQAYLASQQARTNSQNVLNLNSQMNQQAVGAADYTASAYHQALKDAQDQASVNTGKGLSYDLNREDSNYKQAQMAQSRQDANNAAFNQGIAGLGSALGSQAGGASPKPASPVPLSYHTPGATAPSSVDLNAGLDTKLSAGNGAISYPIASDQSLKSSLGATTTLGMNKLSIDPYATHDVHGYTPAPLGSTA